MRTVHSPERELSLQVWVQRKAHAVADQGTVHSTSEGGLAAEHPSSLLPVFHLGPSTGSEFNHLRLPLSTTFCCKIEDVRFAFDSSFVSLAPDPSIDPTSDPGTQPNAMGDIRSELGPLAAFLKKNPGCPLTIFGHSDPVGPDDYNKALSGRRASAIYAILIANTSLDQSAALWNRNAMTEQWGESQKAAMQQATGLPAGTAMPQLIRAYLPKVCPADMAATPADFLAGGSDPAGKGDYQGCSSFNPLLIFSQKKENGFEAGTDSSEKQSHSARNLANAPNRRVLILVFRKGTKVDAAQWPCPPATGDKSGCLKRFWTDGEARRKTRLPEEDRHFNPGHDTFACRFYQRLLLDSPCEDPIELLPFTLRLIDELDRPMGKQRYRLIAGKMTFEGVTADDGTIQQSIPADAVDGTLLLLDKQAHMTPNGEPEPWKLSLQFVALEAPETVPGYQARLDNLGFFTNKESPDSKYSTRMAVQRFQAFYEVHTQTHITKLEDMTDALDDDTLKKLKEVYGDPSA